MRVKSTTFKSVEYFGLNLIVPSEVNYVATDSNGDICGYEEKPTRNDEKYVTGHMNCYWVANVEFEEGENWEDSLKEI